MISACCRDPVNLKEVKRSTTGDGVLVTRRCVVCSRRHFEMLAAPKKLGVRGGG